MHLIRLDPVPILPCVLSPDPSAHQAVVTELAPPNVGDRNTDQLVLIIVSEVALAVASQIAVGVINKGEGRGQIRRDGVGGLAVGGVLRDRRKGVAVVQKRHARLRKGAIAV